MQTLNQARRLNKALGAPIYHSVQGLHDLGVQIRRGDVTLVAAGPGAGKSAFVQAILHHGGGKGYKNSVLYFSFDSSPADMHERAGALSTRMDMDTIRGLSRAGNVEQVNAAIAAKHGHVIYDFSEEPTAEHMELELEAYLELHGEFPEVIVVDNLKDIVDNADADETRATEDAVMLLKKMARVTGAAVITLHHVGGWYEDGDQPIPLSGLRHKVGKTPALVLTINRPNESELRISIVKQRGGRVDPKGGLYIRLQVDLARMSFKDA